MSKISKKGKPYNQLQIISKTGRAGTFNYGGRNYIIWRFMTFWTGYGKPAICAEFVRKCLVDKDGYLIMDNINEGEIIVKPGLVYRKTPMHGEAMANHLKHMQKFTPRQDLIIEKDTEAGPVDLGIVDLRTNK